MHWLGGVQTRTDVAKDVQYFRQAERRDGFTFWVVERFDGTFLGFCGLLRIREKDCPFRNSVEIGWRIRSDAWRNGFAFEAATAALAHGFDHLGIAVVVSRAAAGTVPSRRLMAKLGMRRRRELDYRPHGEGDKLVVYSITARTWCGLACRD
jgi:RimJ/RimL family protein N-acetyltransferase